MDDNNIFKNWIFWAVIIVTVLNFGGLFFSKVGVDKISDKVIEKLRKEYSPSPYGPGLDPDKVDPDTFRDRAIYLELSPKNDKGGEYYEGFSVFERPPTSGTSIRDAEIWHQNWERQRGLK